MTAKPTIATISGTMLAPGVSKNNRLYTREAIGRMVNRAQTRLADPESAPIVMRTHHAAGDDSSRIVGRLTKIEQQPDGSATYEAKLYNTAAGRDMATLIVPDADGRSALRTTSIYGYWVGPVERFKQGGGVTVESGEDLEVEALDLTATPGVAASRIESVTLESAPRHDGRHIAESVEVTTVSLDEDAIDIVNESTIDESDLHLWERSFTAKQRKSMAAAGQAMPGGRYPIANKSDLRNAIRAVGRGSGSHDTIRRHIISRAKALGLSSMIPDTWTSGGTRKENHRMPRIGEHFVKVMVGSEIQGQELKVCADDLSPDILQDAIKQAGKLISQILGQDGREVVGGPDEDDLIDDVDDIDWQVVTCSPDGDDYDSDDVNTMGGYAPKETVKAIRAKMRAAKESAHNKEKESAVPDETKETAVEQAAPASVLTEADMAKLATLIGESVGKAIAEASSNANPSTATNGVVKTKMKNKKGKNATVPDGEPQETATKAAPVAETFTAAQIEEKLAEQRKAITAELRETILRENGLPQRQGFRGVAENDQKEPSGEDLWNNRADVFMSAFPGLFNTPGAAPAPAAAGAES